MRLLPVQKDGWTEVTNIQKLFFRLTIDSATEFLFGESVDSQLAAVPDYVSSKAPTAVSEQEFGVSFDQAQNTIGLASRLGEGYWMVYDKTFKNHCNQCHGFIDHYVQLALTRKKSGAKTNADEKQRYVFLDALVETTEDPLELRSHLISILLAGRDTTASILSYIFMLFTEHPDVYAKLRTIVLEEFGTYNNTRNLTFSSLKSCTYLQWILNEALRLFPVVAVDGRRALRDTTIPTGGGPDGTSPCYVRKGQQVDYSVYVMQRRKDLWGEDAEEFKPERWNGRKSGWYVDSHSILSRLLLILYREYLPFNGGPRICIGQQFALTEAGYVIVRLVQRFQTIEGVGNSWLPKEQGGQGYMRHNLTLTMAPSDGVKLRMKEASA